MTPNDYQRKALATAIYPNKGDNLEYPALGLIGEIGEVANKLKKVQRDDGGVLTDERRTQLSKELGGVMWYIAAASHEHGLELDTVFRESIMYPPAGKISDPAWVVFHLARAAVEFVHTDGSLHMVVSYTKMLASALRLDLFEVMEQNAEILASRAKRGTLQGSGDDR